MSENSLKRYLKHRDKKERGQLRARKHLGLLEKHKDYRLRAKDFHKKREYIRRLQEKATLRNPDEFNLGMTNAQLVDGKLVKKDAKKYTTKQRLKETSVDLKFLTLKSQQERKKAEKLQSSLNSLEENRQFGNKHVIFVDDVEEARDFDAAEHFDTAPSLVGRKFNRLTNEQLEDNVILNRVTPGMFADAEKAREKSYRELNEHLSTLDEVQGVQKRFELHRNLLQKGRRKKIARRDKFGDEIKSKTIYKWKNERKR